MNFNTGLNSLRKFLIDVKDSYSRRSLIKTQHDYAKLRKIRVSVFNASFDNFIKLQTPDQLGVWGNTAFLSTFDRDLDVVINKPNPYVKLNRDIQKNWLLHIEPPGYIRKLGLDSEKILRQFGKVFTCDPNLFEKGGRFIASPPYVHWHLALSSYTSNFRNMVYDYNFLKNQLFDYERDIQVAAINSNMQDLPGHRLRADFITKLCNQRTDIALYGTENWSKFAQYKGKTINGKWPIYSRSKYVLAIENEISPYYWTEKFTDAVLCGAMPVYYGSSNIDKYFPPGSYIPLDITRKTAVDDLKDILASGFYEKNFHKLMEARDLILTTHNMFNFLDSETNKI